MPTNKKVLVSAVGVITFIIIVIAIAYFATGGVNSTIKNQLVALRSGDIAKAYSYTSTDFRNATPLTDFEAFVNHYEALRENKRFSLTEKEIKDDTGVVKGTLYSKEGASTPVEYLLVKEDGEWKILGIQVNPSSVIENAGNGNLGTSEMTNSYDNQDSRYTMKYPGNWEYEKAGDGTVIFSGKRGTTAYFSTVNIQTVLTKKTGGDFSTVKQFMADIKHQAVSQSPGVKFLESGPFEITEKNGKKDKGEYTVFSYTYKDKEFKQWQIVILRSDAQVFYAWAYTSPIAQYPNDLVVAKKMLESWIIY